MRSPELIDRQMIMSPLANAVQRFENTDKRWVNDRDYFSPSLGRDTLLSPRQDLTSNDDVASRSGKMPIN